jgi:hypothetical protein
MELVPSDNANAADVWVPVKSDIVTLELLAMVGTEIVVGVNEAALNTAWLSRSLKWKFGAVILSNASIPF